MKKVYSDEYALYEGLLTYSGSVPRVDAETKLRLISAAATVGRLTGSAATVGSLTRVAATVGRLTRVAATVGRLTETVEILFVSTLRFLIGALLELELLLLLLLLELLRGMIQEEKLAKTFRNLNINIVV